MVAVYDNLRMLRVNQWLKNACVFIGFVYSKQWDNAALLVDVSFGFAAFCLMSSAVYIANDLFDIANDRLHPIKSKRPIANGDISHQHALFAIVLLLICSFILAYIISITAVFILFIYLVINLTYSVYLKTLPVLELLCITSGFLLRVLMGTVAVDISPSLWLILCIGSLTLLLALSKRLAEYVLNESLERKTRRVLEHYSKRFLEVMLYSSAVLTLICYSLYCIYMDHLISNVRTISLLYTCPFAIIGVYRYIYLLRSDMSNDDPVALMRNDKISVANLLIWLGLTWLYLWP